MKILWMTDIHLNFLTGKELGVFTKKLLDQQADHIWITGDIAESTNIVDYLSMWGDVFSKHSPQTIISFVLGNHDFYKDTIANTTTKVKDLCSKHSNLVWMTDSPPFEILPGITLVGTDGWADARLGTYDRSNVVMADFRAVKGKKPLIKDFIGQSKIEIKNNLQKLGDLYAQDLFDKLEQAKTSSDIFVLTHIPPFAESAVYRGQPSAENWLPFFTCKAVGDALTMFSRLEKPKVTVLCGHTHHASYFQPAENLQVYCGSSKHNEPHINKIILIENGIISFVDA